MTTNAKKGEKGDRMGEKKPWENPVLLWQMNEQCMVTKIRVDAIIFIM